MSHYTPCPICAAPINLDEYGCHTGITLHAPQCGSLGQSIHVLPCQKPYGHKGDHVCPQRARAALEKP